MTQFELMLRDTAAALSARFADQNAGHLSLVISIEGRTMPEDIKITFRVSDQYYNGDAVSGGSLDACVDELFRRRGWSQANAPLMLRPPTSPAEAAAVDDMPL
jgi:hypothetical protein